MEISVEIVKILPAQNFQKKDGTAMVRHCFIGKTINTQYPKQICFQVLGDERYNSMNLKIGSQYSVSFDFESRVYNTDKGEQWFTSVQAWRAVLINDKSHSGSSAQNNAYQKPQNTDSAQAGDDIPF